MKYKHIVILTGAGISAESGIDTFRDEGGIWSKVDVMEMATLQGFDRDPERVLNFYNKLRRGALAAEPNAAHVALARLEREHTKAGGTVTIVTQNVDLLHEWAGSHNVIHVHGRGDEKLCMACGDVTAWWHDEELHDSTKCSHCGTIGRVRPNVVWFGEWALDMDRVTGAIAYADLFIAIGTSGAIYRSMPSEAARQGAHTVELNLIPSGGEFDEVHVGPATVVVPKYLESLKEAA